jgi:hypothetical protein
MGTGNTWQRSAMTINHGAYYIDTTVSRKTQMESRFNDPASGYFDCTIVPAGPCQPLSINSFVGGQTYNVYFVYAKGSTRQVYQIYVGEGFDPETAVQAIRVSLYTTPFERSGTVDWSRTGWKRELIAGFDGKKDVLQVTVDMANFAGELDPTHTDAHGVLTSLTCKPVSFCSWNSTSRSCGCALAANDTAVLASPTLKASCDNACKSWATRDLDCPHDGCLGFAFTLPAGFKADDQNKRPPPMPFPTTDPAAGFTALFKSTAIPPDSGAGGTCHYAAPPNACPNEPE